MSLRNLSPQEMFQAMARRNQPSYKFAATDRKGFEQWKGAAIPEVRACLGRFPERCDLNPQLLAEWEHDGLRKQKWIIDIHPDASATFLVNIPGDLAEGEKRPAILCWHGHGQWGKDPVMGNDRRPELKANMEAHNYSYGHQMAQAGFVTYAIDWMGCGERNDCAKPNHHSDPNRDWCNLYYLHATMLGMTSISINVTHGMAATDFAASLDFVDEERLGVMGLSGGGTMTLWTAFCDHRMKAAEIICYSDLWAHFGIRDLNYCGMQVAPGLYRLVDLPDLQGLLCPMPLLIDIGAYDSCFLVDTAMLCYRQVETIYKTAECEDLLELDLHDGEHGWGGNRSISFFRRHLAGA